MKKFVYASSSSVYGDEPNLPKREDRTGNLLSPYALTKYVDELYADVFANTYGIEYIGLRYFNVFGRRQDPESMYAAVIPLFIKQLMSHKCPHINGDGSITRDFTYIDNVIKMNLLAINTTDKATINQIYNTAVGEQTSILQMTNLLIKYLSKYDKDIKLIRPEFGLPRQGDIKHSIASIEKAKKLLAYQPDFSFEKGLEETISWYWSNNKQLTNIEDVATM